MKHHILAKLAVAAFSTHFLGVSALTAGARGRLRDGDQPGLPHDPATSPYCVWWVDYDGSQACSDLLEGNFITMDDFRRWNPSIGQGCSGLKTGNSYCVEAQNEPEPTSAKPTTTTTKAPATTTSASNGITTPSPAQPGIVPDCNKFHLVMPGEKCSTVSSKNNIPVEKFLEWNTQARPSCAGLKTNAYACVSVIGWNPTPTAPPSNGIETPVPTQPEIVTNCNKFYFIQAGETCDAVTGKFSISLSDLIKWNPKVGSTCSGLWAEAYACVSVIGHTPTAPGNGVTTPSPTQPDIVDNCNKFHKIVSGDRCSTVSNKYGIPVAKFLEWNPKALSSCTGLKQNAYACVSVIGFTPTPTAPSNGITTPVPTQPEIVSNCNKFYFVQSGETCDKITTKFGVSMSNFLKWNPKAGSTCSGLWANAYACVSVVGFTPTPTNPGNGITTPSPTQPDIVQNCNKFHLIVSGDKCSTVSNKYGIPVAKFLEWNPKALSSCTGLKRNAYACVSIIGFTPTPTNPGNGIKTPTPIQNDMTGSCKKFHYVERGQTCEVVQGRYGVTLANLRSWNPAIGTNCQSMWAETYLCVGV